MPDDAGRVIAYALVVIGAVLAYWLILRWQKAHPMDEWNDDED